jgi:hypothetical protein
MQTCVIDSCSFLHSFHLSVDDVPLYELLETHFEILIHRDVIDELNSALPRAYSRWRQKGLVSESMSEIRRKHAVWVSNKRSDATLDVPLDSLEQESGAHLDAGEKVCIALAKHTSNERIEYVLLLTDDYEAGKCAQAIFHKYQCGFVVRTADIISFFGLRYKCSRIKIHQALRDLLSFYTKVYETLLSEAESLVAQAAESPIYTLLVRGEFDTARVQATRLHLAPAQRATLATLIDEASQLAGQHGIIGYTLLRLRAMAEIS